MCWIFCYALMPRSTLKSSKKSVVNPIWSAWTHSDVSLANFPICEYPQTSQIRVKLDENKMMKAPSVQKWMCWLVAKNIFIDSSSFVAPDLKIGLLSLMDWNDDGTFGARMTVGLSCYKRVGGMPSAQPWIFHEISSCSNTIIMHLFLHFTR